MNMRDEARTFWQAAYLVLLFVIWPLRIVLGTIALALDWLVDNS